MSQDRALFDDRMLEPEFTAWTYRWIADLGGNMADVYTTQVDNDGNVFRYDSTLVSGITTMNSLGVITNIANVAFMAALPSDTASLTRKYTLARVTPGLTTTFIVYRYTGEIFRRLVTLDVPGLNRIRDWSISPNGRFIALHCRVDAPLPISLRMIEYMGAS